MKDYFRPYTLRPVIADEKPETSDMQNIVGRVMNDASAGLPVQDMEPQTVIAFEDDIYPLRDVHRRKASRHIPEPFCGS